MLFRVRQLLSRYIRPRMWAVLGMLVLSGCGKAPTLPPQNNDYADCWPCAVYTATFEMVDSTLKILMETACQSAMILLGVALLFWILFHVGKMVVSLQQPDIQKFVQPLWSVLFKAIVVAALLTVRENGTYALISFIGENIIQPFFDFFANLSAMILDSNTLVRAATQAAHHADDIQAVNTGILFGDSAGRYLDLIFRIYVALKLGISLGFTVWQEWSIVSFFFGLFIMISFWMLLLTIPMMFVDSIVRIGAALILLPFALVGYVFPEKGKFLKSIWEIILGAGITLMTACFYIVLVVYSVQTYAEKYYPGILGTALQERDPELVLAVHTMSSSLVGFFVLILCMQRLSGSITKIAGHIGGTAVESSFTGAIKTGQKLVKTVAKTAAAVALASPALAKSAAEDIKQGAMEIAQKTTQGGGK